MSEIKVNKIEPVAGDRIVVAAPIQAADAPSDCPDCLATLRQVSLGSAGMPTASMSQSYVDDKADQTLATAKQYTDSEIELLDTTLRLYTDNEKTDGINTANAYTDTKSLDTVASAVASANIYSNSIALGVGQTWYTSPINDTSRITTIQTPTGLKHTVTNPFGRPIMVAISIDSTYNSVIKVDDVVIFTQVATLSLYTDTWDELGLPYPSISSTFIVPADSTYTIEVGQSATFTSWAELR